MTIAGVGYGLLNVATFELLDTVMPARNAVEALTWITSAEGLGLAAGAATTGLLATQSPTAALTLLPLAAATATITAYKRRNTLTVHATAT